VPPQGAVELEALGGDRGGAVGQRAAHQVGKALARKVRLDLDRGIDLLPGLVELPGLFGDIERAEQGLALFLLAVEIHLDGARRQLQHIAIGAERHRAPFRAHARC
jgi:hypothetical protein